jgi:hypothetical protein
MLRSSGRKWTIARYNYCCEKYAGLDDQLRLGCEDEEVEDRSGECSLISMEKDFLALNSKVFGSMSACVPDSLGLTNVVRPHFPPAAPHQRPEAKGNGAGACLVQGLASPSPELLFTQCPVPFLPVNPIPSQRSQ